MSLTLTILSFKGQPVPYSTVVTMGEAGGTIGRSDHNTLVLADPERFVSRQHASISFKNGCYYLADSSLSGVFIDGEPQALHNGSQQIFDGTRLKIGEYEIAVSIVDEANVADFSFAQPETPPPLLPVDDDFLSPAAPNINSLFSDNSSAFVSHEDLMQRDHNPLQPAFESKLQGNSSSPIFDSYIPPNISKPVSAIEEIPADFSFADLLADVPEVKAYSSHVQTDDAFLAALDQAVSFDENPPANAAAPAAILEDSSDESAELTGIFASAAPVAAATPIDEPVIAPVNVSPAPTALGSERGFTAFLQGAGIHHLELQPEQIGETMQRVGQMFRSLIDGSAALLRSRAEFKSLFRVNMTVIRSANNNPLKFTVSTDDLLRQLLENKSSGFLDSTSAIEEGFTDIMNHQLAMQAGIQASLEDLLKNFDPKRIEKQFEQGLVLQKKSKCWDKFTETYQNSVDNAVDDFFGEAFVEAYEAQIKVLTAQRKQK